MAWAAVAPVAMSTLGWSGVFTDQLLYPSVGGRNKISGRQVRMRKRREFEFGSCPCGAGTTSRCNAVLSTPAFPPQSAEQLQDAFGREGLSFNNVGGDATAQLKLENGCKASVMVSGARVTAYKTSMWHGGEEEFLHTRRGSGKDGGPSLRGGVELRFFHTQDPLSSIFSPSENLWTLEEVFCDPLLYSQIILTNSSTFEMGMVNPVQGSLKFRYVVTLTDRSLTSALIIVNTGPSPVEFTGSIVTCYAVANIDGTYVSGFKGEGYRCLSSPSPPPKVDFWTQLWYSKPVDNRVASPPPEANGNLQAELERGRWIVEEKHNSQVFDGDDRLYPTPPTMFTVLDKGYRRTMEVRREGFEEFFLSNPGEGNVPDWDDFINVGPAQISRPVRLEPNEEWRGAQILFNLGFGDHDEDKDE